MYCIIHEYNCSVVLLIILCQVHLLYSMYMYVYYKDLLLNYILYYVYVGAGVAHVQVQYICFSNFAGAVQIELSPCSSEPDILAGRMEHTFCLCC